MISGCDLSCNSAYEETIVTSALTAFLPNGGKLMEFTGGIITLADNYITN